MTTAADLRLYTPLVPPLQHPGFKHAGEPKPDKIVLPQGYQHVQGGRRLPQSLVFLKDQPIPTREGDIYGDFFMPEGTDALPVILHWTPYGKTDKGVINYSLTTNNAGVRQDSISWLNTFEGLDPAEWCTRDYIIAQVDLMGASFSAGPLEQWTQREAWCLYDVIDWISKQKWSNGAIGMAGNSWLATGQINVATKAPHPALKALAPWEGMTDEYVDLTRRGGVPQFAFPKFISNGLAGHNGIEDFARETQEYSLHTHPVWQEKALAVERLSIPTYILASYSTGLHTPGSVRTFRESTQLQDKWLRWHNAQEWSDLYKTANTNDLQKFFDYYLAGKTDNGWPQAPRVRLALLDFYNKGTDIVGKVENEYPLKRQELVKLFLNAKLGSLESKPVTESSSASYEAHSEHSRLAFRYTFTKRQSLVGFSAATLFVEPSTETHLDIHVMLRKVSASGQLLSHTNFDHGSYEVPLTNSTENEPHYNFDSLGPKIRPSQVVEVQIPIWPGGIVFNAGESIELHVAGHSMRLPEFPMLAGLHDENDGQHTPPEDSINRMLYCRL
ncbi:hypothetical protein OIO90_004613 [Microbotryomycetes sp. JL221]|nr:hypothetical protein OIO90_004613 [Microbotryomycetes sp. JL221]